MSAMSEVCADLRSYQSKKAAHDGYKAHMRAICQTADEAAKFDVHSHQKAMAVMIGKLAGLQLTRIVGEADGNDAAMLADDLRDFSRIVDAFVAEIGSYAGNNFGRVDEKLFANVLSDAIDGNALYELETAGERREEEIRDAVAGGAHRVAAE